MWTLALRWLLTWDGEITSFQNPLKCSVYQEEFSHRFTPPRQRKFYISVVRSKLLYCSPIWRPHLLTDIKALENVQKRATSFIVCNSLLNYCHRLLNLKLLPLMMVFEINDILFFIKSLKEPSDYFDISTYVSFSSGQTRLFSHLKLRHASAATSNSSRNFYFNWLPQLWNSLPLLDINQSIPTNFISTFEASLLQTLILTLSAPITTYVPVLFAALFPSRIILIVLFSNFSLAVMCCLPPRLLIPSIISLSAPSINILFHSISCHMSVLWCCKVTISCHCLWLVYQNICPLAAVTDTGLVENVALKSILSV